MGKERQASKKFYNKCSENSRSQIVFRTDIFQKLSLGAPAKLLLSLVVLLKLVKLLFILLFILDCMDLSLYKK